MIHQELNALVEKCRDAKDVDSQVMLLHEINASLPRSERIKMPMFITDDYCRRALEIVEDRIARPPKQSSRRSREFSI